MSNMQFNTNEQLKKLADILARNLITNSFAVTKALLPIKTILEKGAINQEQRCRNILVVGAGASHNVHKDIPLATEAIHIVKKAFLEKYGPMIENFVEKKISELTQIYKLNSTDFETQMLACSLIDPELVLVELERVYNLRYPVNLFYEIVAHLFKHRFIDVIINFNFDEMLDNSIEEEMAESQYKYIYSDGHCPERMEELLYDNRLTVPVYIKPHGTISHPSTLRFTREAYYNTPSKITNTIIYLLQAEIGYTTNKEILPGKKEQLPVNLIVAGFGLKSHEFNSILSKTLSKERCNLFYFDVFSDPKKLIWKRTKEDKIAPFAQANTYMFPLLHNQYGNRTLNDWFYSLWCEIRSSFKEAYQPKDITRHVILHEIFNPLTKQLLDNHYKQVTYFKDRTIIEIAIEILTSPDGLINFRQFRESRVNKYFSLYKKQEFGEWNFFEFLQLFNLNVYKTYLKDTWYFLKGDTKFSTMDLERTVLQNLSQTSQSLLRSTINRRLMEYTKKISSPKKLFLNIQNVAKDNYISIFQKVTPNDVINTDIKWIYIFHHYFVWPKLRKKWNLVLSISETGGFFNKSEILKHLDHKKFMFICSYSAFQKKEEKRKLLLEQKLRDIKPYILKNKGQEELRMLPFRSHNQHVVLFTRIDDSKKEMELVGGIYYSRRDMSKRVSPIHITDKDDLIELFATFANYWDRAKKADEADIIRKSIVEGNANTEAVIQLAKTTTIISSLKEIEAQIIDIYINDN